MKVVSDSELVTRLREILSDSDLDTATAATVRRQLEEDFGADLSERKAFIRDQIDIFLQTLAKPHEEEEEEEEEEDDEKENEEEEDEGEGEGENVKFEENDAVEEDNEAEGSNKGRTNKEVKRRGGFNKLCSLSPQLQKFVGVPELARTEVVKKIWSYIKANNLQNPKNKRKILCDESLRALFRVNSIDMFQMNKALSKHIWPLSAEDENLKQKIKVEDGNDSMSEGEEENNTEEEDKEEEEEEQEKEVESRRASKKGGSTNMDKDVKKNRGGFNKLCSLSPQLQALVGVPELARTEVVKRLWTYIKENNLQDPKNKRKIICDESFRALFRVDSIDMFQMNKALSKHIWPLNEGYDKIKVEDSNDSMPEEEGENFPEEEDKEEEEEEEEVEESRGVSKKGGSTNMDKDVKKNGVGFNKLCSLSPQLQTLVGVPELARTEVVKRLWTYIKENNLQDPKNKRNIICDESLRALFRVDSINMFQMNKALSKHIWPLNEEYAPYNSSPKERQCKQGREEGPDGPKRKEKRQKIRGSGFLAPLQLSDALVNFFGTGENKLSRTQVIKKIWEYIKQNDLQDPSDKRRIICDGKLKELFEVDSFHGFTVTKLLVDHLIKIEQ